MSDEASTDAADDAKQKRKKLIDRIMWAVLALTIAATLTWRCVADRGADDATFTVRCLPETPRSVACIFESDKASAGVCVDLVMTCDNREHRANVCSGALEAATPRTAAVGELTPPLSAKPVCAKPRYENERRAD